MKEDLWHDTQQQRFWAKHQDSQATLLVPPPFLQQAPYTIVKLNSCSQEDFE